MKLMGDFRYKGDADKTQASRHGDFFTVGDMGELDEDGFLYLRDRKIDMIISGGVNIYPYSDSYEPLACNGVDSVTDGGTMGPGVESAYPGCEGGELGLFDTDVLCAQARQVGFSLACCKDLFIHHFGTRTFAHGAPQTAADKAKA